MALQIDTVEHACKLITREIKDYQKTLTIHYIIHHEGQRTEALGLAAQEILPHPASETAMHFLQKKSRGEDSILLGTAVARQNIFLGLITRDSLLALCTINIDQFETLKDAKRHAYHLAWHALDAASYHSDPQNRTGNAKEIIVRKRNALELAYANMKADVFSAAISAFHRDKDAARRIALKRGLNAIKTRSLHSPEFYPFAIAVEATEFALSQVNPKTITKKKIVPTALKIATAVSKTYDESTLRHWLAFSEPAQDMAWQGYSEAEILGAAINTSPDTYIRATGYLVSELAAIDPSSILDVNEKYSPFADAEFNANLHEKMIDQIYQDVIAQGLQQDSSLPFLDMANKQNSSLTDGNVLGWCASALQAAGVAYDRAKEKGDAPEYYAEQEFQNKKQKTSWEELRGLSKDIVKSQRQGNNVTLSELQKIAEEIKGLQELRESVTQTIRDPQYQHRLAAANELAARPNMAPEGPAKPAPSAVPKTPVHGLSIPGLGGAAKTVQQQQTSTSGDTQAQGEGRE